MLTGKEKAELLRLQKMEKEYTPLSDEELERIEEVGSGHLLGPLHLEMLAETWKKIFESVYPLIEDNLKLVREVRYWREKAAQLKIENNNLA